MGVSTVDENASSDSTEFKPFDESRSSELKLSAHITLVTTGSNPGMDTRDIDGFRQGIEITRNSHRFKGSGGKIWSGNTNGYTVIRTVGQSLSFTDYEGTKIFEETQTFDPITYISSSEDVWFDSTIDDQPIGNKEANFQPFTIKSRDGKNAGNDPDGLHDIRGAVEDGNQQYDVLNGFTSRVEQFISLESNYIAPFLDNSGKILSGTFVTASYLKANGVLNQTKMVVAPFDDLTINKFANLFSGSNHTDIRFVVTMSNLVLSGSDINYDEDIRERLNRKSATAGYSVYGPTAGQEGTDSIAFNGWIKGN